MSTAVHQRSIRPRICCSPVMSVPPRGWFSPTTRPLDAAVAQWYRGKDEIRAFLISGPLRSRWRSCPPQPTARSRSAPTCGTRRPGRTFPAASTSSRCWTDASRRLSPPAPSTSPASGCRRASPVRGSANGTPVMRTIAAPGSKIQSLSTRAVTRLLAWLDGHAEVSVRGPVPCDVQPDRRSWPCTTRSGLWPEEATAMPAVPGEAWQQSLLAACVLFMARTGAGRGGRRAGPCSRWLPAGSRCG